MVLVAGAPWYEFWRHGIWSYGHWTYFHATWWVWALRGDLLIGLALAFLLLLGMSGSFNWFSVAFGALLVAVWAFVPGITQALAVFALLTPAMLVWLLVWVGAERVARLWRSRRGSVPAEPADG